MKLVHADEVPMNYSSNVARPGEADTRPLLRGETGLGNFSCTHWFFHEDYHNIRHHHNFCQWRYQTEGTEDYGSDGKFSPGQLGYFPEGTYYGPQTGPPHSGVCVQFDGPSGRGYMSPDQRRAALAELSKSGVFEDGVYKRNEDVQGLRNQDAVEAMWEQANGRKIAYPKPQYERWIRMDLKNYPWIPTGEERVSERALGTFSSAKLRAASYRLESGAAFTVGGRGIIMVLCGKGAVEGQGYRQETYVYLGDDEQATYAAVETTELLYVGLPSFAYLEAAEAAATAEREAVLTSVG